MRIAVYTCVTNGYDRPDRPAVFPSNVDYLLFIDTPQTYPGWNSLPIPDSLVGLGPVKAQRVVKICPRRFLPDGYDVSVWVDGNLRIVGDMNRLVEEYDLGKTPLYTRIHPGRNCIYEEAKAVKALGKEDPDIVDGVVARYRSEGYPEHAGLAETCAVLRNHNDAKCRAFCDEWAAEVMLNSKRDQLSFNYVAWKTGFLPGYMVNQFKAADNDYFILRRHG